jgi:hypothetical protein
VCANNEGLDGGNAIAAGQDAPLHTLYLFEIKGAGFLFAIKEETG